MVGIPNAFGELVALQVMFFNRRSLSFIKKEGKLYNLKEKSMYILVRSPKAVDSLYWSHADTRIFLVHTPSKSENGQVYAPIMLQLCEHVGRNAMYPHMLTLLHAGLEYSVILVVTSCS